MSEESQSTEQGSTAAAAGAQASPGGLRGVIREGRAWFITAFLVLLVIAIVVVLYALKVHSMEFFYVLF